MTRRESDVSKRPESARSRQLLVAVSAAQLATGVVGHVIALRQGRSYQILGWHGDPDRIRQESWSEGTGLSAPVQMLCMQAAAIAVLSRRTSRVAAGTLAALGATMTVGLLLENEFRRALLSARWDPVLIPVGGAGLALAIAMAAMGSRAASGLNR